MPNADRDGLRLILHVGAGKCGSSALQAALSRAPEPGGGVRYAVIAADGRVLPAQRLRGLATVNGYHVSVGPNVLDTLNLGDVARGLRALGGTVILSSEGWWTSPKLIGQLVAATGAPARAILYLRPQPEFANSAWWQWGAWGDETGAAALRRLARRADWAAAVRRWQAACPDVPLDIRPVPRDVVADFFANVIDRPPPEATPARANATLPAAVLRLYQRNRVLRPAPHAGGMDFTLGRVLDLPGGAPWVIGNEMLTEMLADARAGNAALAEAMPPERGRALRDDPRWWSPSAYADRVTAPMDPPPPDPAEIATICRQLEAAAPGIATAPPETEARCVELARHLHARARRAAGLPA